MMQNYKLRSVSWVRTCQECGHVQADNPPDTSKELPASYTERKCRRCKSSALDYGHVVR